MLHAQSLSQPWIPAEFHLVDQTGATFTRDDLHGRWTVVFSGFTNCPDICPATLAILRAAGTRVERPERIRTVFATVDPDRDTPQRLAEYLGAFNADWIGLTGDASELDRLLGSLQMAHMRVPTGGGKYTMDHATAVALLDPQARMIAYWTAPLNPAELAEDLNRLPQP